MSSLKCLFMYYCLHQLVCIFHFYLGMELKKAVLDIQDDLDSTDIYSQDPKQDNLPAGFKSFGEAFAKAPSTQPDKSHRSGIKYSTPYVFIYTSGTTGNIHLFILKHVP